jgi:hypothetical protein
MFELFVYPYISRNALLKITDSFIFSRISTYLSECCKKIEDTLEYLDHTFNQRNGNLTQQLFTWENIPNNEEETDRLRQFLYRRLSLDWVEKAEIKKQTPESITISYGSNSVLISLDNKGIEAIVTYRGARLYNFIVRRCIENRSTIEVDEFLMPGRGFITISLNEKYIYLFIIFQQAQVMDLIFSLFSAYGASSAATQILAKDDNFQAALAKAKKHFVHGYDIFTRDVDPHTTMAK